MEKKANLFNIEDSIDKFLSMLTTSQERSPSLASYSIFTEKASQELKIKDIVLHFTSSQYSPCTVIDRAIGSLMALSMGDSIGSQNESRCVSYTSWNIKDFDESAFKIDGVEAGQYTDDTAMALCLADSLIKNKGLDCQDFLKRCVAWWYFGYNNGTGFNANPPKASHGGGRTTRGALLDFINSDFTKIVSTTDGRPSNGSIMRLSPVAIYYYNDINEAIEKASEQSKTTHKFPEVTDCSKILAYIIVKCLNYEEKWKGQSNYAKNFLDKLDFRELKDKLESETARLIIASADPWDWKKEDFIFPLGKGGLYATEAITVALHCMYVRNSPTESILRSVNYQGDADTLGAICGQIVGALYGISSFPEKWCKYVLKWDREGDIALKAILLVTKGLKYPISN